MALAGGGDVEPFKGGWHWQAAVYALWEAFVCVSMCMGLVHAFRRYRNTQGRVAALLSRNAYTAYLTHGPVITILALAARGIMWYPLIKWVVVGLAAVPVCFLLSNLIRKLPYTDKVL